MNIYPMSETGYCSRVISAKLLGNQETPRTPGDLEKLEYYSSLEAVAARKLSKLGFSVEEAGRCKACGRNGFHVEIKEKTFKLVGHLDRTVSSYRDIPFEKELPVEIKCLGPDSWKEFRDFQFSKFSEYASQEACYLEAEQSPGLYIVMNRDSGELLKYIVNDSENTYNFEGFEKITLPVTFMEVLAKLYSIERDISSNKLSDAEPTRWCWFCNFKYLCVKKEKSLIVISDPLLDKYAEQYRMAHTQIDGLESQKREAVDFMINYAITNGVEQFTPRGVSFTYRGMTSRTSLNGKALQETLDKLTITDKDGKSLHYGDIYPLITKKSKEFPDYSIRIMEE